MKAEGRRQKVEGRRRKEAQNLRAPPRSGVALGQALCFGQPGIRLLLWLAAFCLLPSTFYLLPSAFSAPAATGARIDESKVVHTYYVDPAGADSADDDQHGTQESPFTTFGYACRVAARDKDANVGAKIILGPGVYREAVEFPPPAKADTDAPLVIEAAEHDQAIIDAADAAGWTADTWRPEPPALVHPWPFAAAPPSPAPRNGRPMLAAARPARSELVFLGDSALRQVASAAALVPGSFCVAAGADRRAATVRVRLPEDAGGEALTVGARPGGLTIFSRRNVVVRGLLFQHAANPAELPAPPGGQTAGLAVVACSNVLIEDVLSQWNEGAGLVLEGVGAPGSAGFTLRRVRLIHNGGSGLIATSLKNVLAEDCETSFNNFRAEWAGAFDPAGAAGVKARALHGSTWRRQRAVGNPARGLWWAGDCTDLTVEDAVVRGNFFSGLLLEACPGPSVVRGCLVSDNKLPPASAPGGGRAEAAVNAGVLVEASPDVTLENNVVAGNVMPQLAVRNTPERAEPNFETGDKTPLRAERHLYRHNLFWGADAAQPLCELPSEAREGKGDFGFYYSTLDSDENCFWNPALPQAFATYERGGARAGMAMDAWRAFLAGRAGAGAASKPEGGSLWQDPLLMEPAEGDYRLQAQSPLIDWGLPSEEGAVAQ